MSEAAYYFPENGETEADARPFKGVAHSAADLAEWALEEYENRMAEWGSGEVVAVCWEGRWQRFQVVAESVRSYTASEVRDA